MKRLIFEDKQILAITARAKAVFFHSADLSQEEFITEHVPGAIFVKQIGDFLFYKSPS